MDKEKLIKRSLVDEILAIGKNESWLSDMAQKGRILKGFSVGKMYFEKGEPINRNYRIAILNPDEDQQNKELYKEHGWEYLDKDEDHYIFYTDSNLNHSEVPVSEETKEYVTKYLHKYRKSLLLEFLGAIGLTFVIMYSLYNSFHWNGFYYEIVINSTIGILFIPYLITIKYYGIFRKYRLASHYKKALLLNGPIEHHQNYKTSYFIKKANVVMFALVLLYLIGSLFLGFGSKTYTLEQAEKVMPILRLSDIEQDERLVLDTNNLVDPFLGIDEDDYNNVEKSSTFLALTVYDSDEYGIIPANKKGKDDYESSLYVDYYYLRSPKLVKPLIKDIMDSDKYNFYEKDMVELKDRRVDKIYFVNNGYSRDIIICKGNKVACITYDGKQPTERVIEAAIGKLM